MKINLISIFILLTTTIGYSQLFEKPMLVDFTPSECDEESDVYRLKTRIINKWIKGDTLLVEVGTQATCCVEFIPSIEFIHDTLNLMFKETGDACECNCCYQFIYHIVGLKDFNIPIKLQNATIELSNEKYLTYPIKYELMNGDTINYVDKYGQKQGYWFSKRDSSMNYMRAFAKNDKWQYQEIVYYNDSSRIRSINIIQDYSNSINTQFYDNGSIKKQTTRNKGFFQEIKFYPNGTLMSLYNEGEKQYYQRKEYYPNGQLRIEWHPSSDKNLVTLYYYNTGELMAEFYMYKKDMGFSHIEKWNCYDKNGKSIDKEELVNLGLLEK